MLSFQPQAMTELIEHLSKLPGIGRKTATRLALFFLKQPKHEVEMLAESLLEVKNKIKFCSKCYNFSSEEICSLCVDPRRDIGVLAVVENPGDLMALESAAVFKGRYHILGGALEPLNGIGPDDLRIKELFRRLQEEDIQEVFLALGSSPEGESTAIFLSERLKEFGVKVTRIARGIPTGIDLEYVDEATLKKAMENRREE